jgi:hypothetical protein
VNLPATSEMLLWPLLLIALIVALAVLAKLAPRSPKFVRKDLLTTSEIHLLRLLETALPGHWVMAQVAMGALLQAGENSSKRARATRNRFSQKIVDFVIVSRKTAEVIALVELDDRTHRAAKDRVRDAMTLQAGYRTIRIKSRPLPTATSVRAAVGDLLHLGPTSPKHGA